MSTVRQIMVRIRVDASRFNEEIRRASAAFIGFRDAMKPYAHAIAVHQRRVERSRRRSQQQRPRRRRHGRQIAT